MSREVITTRMQNELILGDLPDPKDPKLLVQRVMRCGLLVCRREYAFYQGKRYLKAASTYDRIMDDAGWQRAMVEVYRGYDHTGRIVTSMIKTHKTVPGGREVNNEFIDVTPYNQGENN